MKAIADEVESKMGESMDVVVGETMVDLEGRFLAVRTRETNLGRAVINRFHTLCCCGRVLWDMFC